MMDTSLNTCDYTALLPVYTRRRRDAYATLSPLELGVSRRMMPLLATMPLSVRQVGYRGFRVCSGWHMMTNLLLVVDVPPAMNARTTSVAADARLPRPIHPKDGALLLVAPAASRDLTGIAAPSSPTCNVQLANESVTLLSTVTCLRRQFALSGI